VGHVRPLLPLAKRLVERGYTVVWAISGDANEPASAWAEQLTALGVRFVDLDDTSPFPRGSSPEINKDGMFHALWRRLLARANDVGPGAADAIGAAVAGRPIVGGIYDYFAIWAYVAMRRLGIAQIDVAISAFPNVFDNFPDYYSTDELYNRELGVLRTAGFGAFDAIPIGGVLPRDPGLRAFSFTSPHLCPDAPSFVRVLGVQHDALPRAEDLGTAPDAHQALARRLQQARADGTRVVLLSMGTVVTRVFTKLGPSHTGFLRRLYTTLAASALRAGALVVASTCDSTAADFGLDEAALGPAARDRVIAMPFVPQPLLFAHGLVDVMLMHGGANTFHEAVVSGIPLLISPGFGDQEGVAKAVAKLGVGVCVESITIPNLDGALSIDRVADEVLPAMLAPGTSAWKAAATRLADHVAHEDGLGAAEALVTGSPRELPSSS